MDEPPIEGDIIEPDDGRDPGDFEDPFRGFLFPSRPFGELLVVIRSRISEALGRAITQEEFGDMLGHVNQVTISRWQVGKQEPQRAQLQKIVDLANEYGMKGVTMERLQQSLHRDVEMYAAIDPRIVRLNTLLLPETEEFKDRFFELVVAVYHLLRGALR